MNLRFYDAHNHLQDDRFGGQTGPLIDACRRVGVVRMVVNGACESDWPHVLELARQYPEVLPSLGIHPWYVAERTDEWLLRLAKALDRIPAAVGEIGLDRWKPGLPYEGQEEVFLAQLALAAERDLPVSVHCLRAWGRLFELLRAQALPASGFLLHSYGGPKEMVKPLTELGAYFSFPGYYLHARKVRQREAFLAVPLDRLLIETDAPDQRLPSPAEADPAFRLILESANVPSLTCAKTGQPVNHPANLPLIYRCVARFLGESETSLTQRVEANFNRLFSVIPRS
jgi:TatD DNase family protein